MSSANSKVQDPSMEEILASIRRIIADDQESARAEARSPSAPLPEGEADDPAASADGGEGDDTENDVRQEPDPGPTRTDVLVSSPEVEAKLGSALTGKAEEADRAPGRPVLREPGPKSSEAAEPLLSGAANSSISRSFQTLTSTVRAKGAPTLEETVKDMLRPMLKAWLDDNLPALVERLVRAEIERVARGGR